MERHADTRRAMPTQGAPRNAAVLRPSPRVVSKRQSCRRRLIQSASGSAATTARLPPATPSPDVEQPPPLLVLPPPLLGWQTGPMDVTTHPIPDGHPPHGSDGDGVGVGATQIPSTPQCWPPGHSATLQHSPSTQKLVAQSLEKKHESPGPAGARRGVGVTVDVTVGDAVGRLRPTQTRASVLTTGPGFRPNGSEASAFSTLIAQQASVGATIWNEQQ